MFNQSLVAIFRRSILPAGTAAHSTGPPVPGRCGSIECMQRGGTVPDSRHRRVGIRIAARFGAFRRCGTHSVLYVSAFSNHLCDADKVAGRDPHHLRQLCRLPHNIRIFRGF